MSERKKQPEPITSELLQKKIDKLSTFLEHANLWDSTQSGIGRKRFDRLVQCEFVLDRQIQLFEQEPLSINENILRSVIAGKDSIPKNDYIGVINEYNKQVHNVIDSVKMEPPIRRGKPWETRPFLPQQVERIPDQFISPVSLEQITLNLNSSIPDIIINKVSQLYGKRRGEQLIHDDTINLSQLILYEEKGAIHSPSLKEILEKTPDQEEKMISFAILGLRKIIATQVIPQGIFQDESDGLKHKIARRVNDLLYVLGGQGQNVVVKALQNLSELERSLLFSRMSTNLKSELDFPDIDLCNPMQIAKYIKTLTFDYEIDKYKTMDIRTVRKVGLSDIIDTVNERMRDESDFSTYDIIEILLNEPSVLGIFENMIHIAREDGTVIPTALFFEQHPETQDLARECREYESNERY